MRKTTLNSHPAELKPGFSAKAVFGALLPLLLLAAGFTTTIQAQNAADDARASASSLKLWGTPGDVRLVAGEPNVKVRVSLNVIAENTGKENLLLLRRTPESNSEEIVSLANPAVSIWHQEHEAGAQTNTDPALPKLRRALDQQEPPEDELITLGPGDSIGWNVVVQLDIPKGSGPAGWDSIRKACPCAIKLDLDLWPLALEPSGDRADPGFGRKLAKRWHKKGALIFTTKQTDPIEVKLPEK
jgi:hypothetical protein